MSTAEFKQITRHLVDKLLSDYSPQKIILFGSCLKGSPNPDSDIDLLIVKETNDRFIDRWTTVRKILSDPSRKVAIETLVLTPQEISDRLSIGDQFLAEIMEKGKVLYAA